ncbi:hypothetical protein RB653_003579 [Dictyostelium firmibasis]|uniref:Peptidase C14 caspase domain-containing protein n=1 Tax=Dictyostelium firmibasis TaxID=79012 RepID=A0AAN7U8A0_9MYCE
MSQINFEESITSNIFSVSVNRILFCELEQNNDYDNDNNNNCDVDEREYVFIDSSKYNQQDFIDLRKNLEEEKKPIHEVIHLKNYSTYKLSTHLPEWLETLLLYSDLKSVNIYDRYYELQLYIGPNCVESAFPLYRVQYRYSKNDISGQTIKFSNNLDECEAYFNHLCKVFNVLTQRLSLGYICLNLSDSFYLLNSSAIKKSSRTRLAFIIGNSKYEEGVLSGVANDAISFYSTLLGCSFQSDHIIRLSDQDLRSFYKQWELFLEMIKTFQSYIEVIVYYAGHGRTIEGRLNLVMMGGGILELSTIASSLTESIKNKESLCLFIIDCCRDAKDIGNFVHPIESFDDKKNIAFLFACKYGEVSYESRDLDAGIFTRYFTKTILERKNKDIRTICNYTDIAIKKIIKNYNGCSLLGTFDCAVLEF